MPPNKIANMKTVILRQNDFYFNGIPSNEFLLMGQSCIDYIKKEFGDCIVVDELYTPTELTVFVHSRCPFAKMEDVERVIKFLFAYNRLGACSSFCTVLTPNTSPDKCVPYDLHSLPVFASLTDYPFVVEQLRRKINLSHLQNGVLIEDIDNVYIEESVKILHGAVIKQNSSLRGNTVVGACAVINAGCDIFNSVIGNNAYVTASFLTGASIGEKTTVGPFAYLREGSKIGDNCRIGDYVEIKNSIVGNNTKISHLAYIGDAEIGNGVNIGCGVVFANYDGKNKHKTVIGNDCFIGSNCNLIAPLKIGNNVFVAAATTVTGSLGDGDFCIGRVRQEVKEKYAHKFLKNQK